MHAHSFYITFIIHISLFFLLFCRLMAVPLKNIKKYLFYPLIQARVCRFWMPMQNGHTSSFNCLLVDHQVLKFHTIYLTILLHYTWISFMKFTILFNFNMISFIIYNHIFFACIFVCFFTIFLQNIYIYKNHLNSFLCINYIR